MNSVGGPSPSVNTQIEKTPALMQLEAEKAAQMATLAELHQKVVDLTARLDQLKKTHAPTQQIKEAMTELLEATAEYDRQFAVVTGIQNPNVAVISGNV